MSILTDDEIVERVIRYTESSAFDLTMARDHLRTMLKRGSWKRFRTPNGNEVKHDRFIDFVVAPRPSGIETTVDDLKRIVSDDNEATVLLRNALKGKPGPRSHDNIRETGGPDAYGTSRSHTLDRLAREAPELRQRVDAGELSANAAAIKAGFRPRTFTVRADPESAARTLKKQLTQEQVAQLKELL